MSTKDGWDSVESPINEEIEYEIEEAEEIIEVASEETENPKELEGIETKGAEKRIRQLVKQRKEREEQKTSGRANF